MKRIIGVICLLAIASLATAQSKSQPKGPAAKNAKPWEKSVDVQSNIAVAQFDQEKVKGPAAKNAKPWQKEQQPTSQAIVASGKTRHLKGPEYKNRKIWEDAKATSPTVADQPSRKPGEKTNILREER